MIASVVDLSGKAGSMGFESCKGALLCGIVEETSHDLIILNGIIRCTIEDIRRAARYRHRHGDHLVEMDAEM